MAKQKRDWEKLIHETQRSTTMGAKQKQRAIQAYRSEMTRDKQREEQGGKAETRPKKKPVSRSTAAQDRVQSKRTSVPRIDEEMKKLGIY